MICFVVSIRWKLRVHRRKKNQWKWERASESERERKREKWSNFHGAFYVRCLILCCCRYCTFAFKSMPVLNSLESRERGSEREKEQRFKNRRNCHDNQGIFLCLRFVCTSNDCSCFTLRQREHVEMCFSALMPGTTSTNDIEFLCSILLSNSLLYWFDVGWLCYCCCSIVLTSVFNLSVSQYDCKNTTYFLFYSFCLSYWLSRSLFLFAVHFHIEHFAPMP